MAIQKVIMEKNEKLANIEFERAIKKEFGKPKSITKRTLKEYENGEQDTCEEVVEEAPVVREKTQSEIDLDKKIEFLTSDHLGLYKVLFVNNNIIKGKSLYIYASDMDNVYTQIAHTAESDGIVDADVILDKIKNVIRMTANAIRIDKDCLKRIAEDSVSDIEKMYNDSKALDEEIEKEAFEKFREITKKGYEVYIGKLMPKDRVRFVEFARTDEEANAIVLSETRTQKALLSGEKIEGAALGKIMDIVASHKDEYEEATDEEIEEILMKLIKDNSKKGDHIHKFLFGSMTVDEYIENMDKIGNVLEKFKNGDGKEIIIQKLDELTEALGQRENLLTSFIKKEQSKLALPRIQDKIPFSVTFPKK